MACGQLSFFAQVQFLSLYDMRMHPCFVFLYFFYVACQMSIIFDSPRGAVRKKKLDQINIFYRDLNQFFLY